MHSTMDELAHGVGGSERTILRCCRSIGCSGCQDRRLKPAPAARRCARFRVRSWTPRRRRAPQRRTRVGALPATPWGGSARDRVRCATASMRSCTDTCAATSSRVGLDWLM
ncbi:hypothetical protein [Pseudomonas aeruginosa]|uniref:hypothetical protein n=1 Tax=Pseudomonas aeruginosa TaxID=287 RepID=UPI00358EF784